jgi:hypothetical protein
MGEIDKYTQGVGVVDVGINGKEGMDWVNVNQDRDKWQAVYFHKVQGIS